MLIKAVWIVCTEWETGINKHSDIKGGINITCLYITSEEIKLGTKSEDAFLYT